MGEYNDDSVWPFITVAILFIEVPKKRTKYNMQKFLLSCPEYKEKAFHSQGCQRLEHDSQRVK